MKVLESEQPLTESISEFSFFNKLIFFFLFPKAQGLLAYKDFQGIPFFKLLVLFHYKQNWTFFFEVQCTQ